MYSPDVSVIIDRLLFQSLVLPINKIQNVHEDAFKPLISLDNLNMTGNLLHHLPFLRDICDTLVTLILLSNQISEIPDLQFIECTKLHKLNLRKNLIIELTNQSLVGLDSLEQLDLSYNLIASIGCHAFWGLSSVKNIALDYNDLRPFPCYCFENKAIKMTIMNLHANKIENVSPSVIKCASPVEILFFGLAQIDNLRFISSLPNLKTLVSAAGKPLTIDNMTFSASFSLEYVKIVSCGLQEFPVLSVSKNVTIKLILNDNQIGCIDVPRITGLEALRYLDLDKNGLRHFPSDSCPRSDPPVATEANFSFPSLKRIYINNNRLEVFPVLPGLANKSLIELNYNIISQFPVQNLARLRTAWCIKMSHNLANSFPDFSMLFANQLAIIHLDNNRIKSIPYAYISTLVHLEELTLDHNLIDALPDMEFCIPQLVHFPLHHNLLQDLGPMIATVGSQWKIINWDISYNNLTTIPKPLLLQLTSLEYLNASCNLIEDMPYLTAVAAKVISVNLSYNHIRIIPAAHMYKLLSLEYLDLQGNLLNEFPFWTLGASTTLYYLNLEDNMLSSLHIDFPKLELSDTAVINIRQNPLLCDQNLCWMRRYKPLVLLRDLTPCVAPAPLVGAVFDDLTDRQLECLCKCVV